MVSRAPRFLLALAALLAAAGTTLHALPFGKAAGVITASSLPPFYRNTFQALWLGDSANLFALALLFGLIAARPAVATRPIVLLLAVLPAATAALIYWFLGMFFAGHILVVIAGLASIAGLRFPRLHPT